jgi:tRNA-specific 2-thiouridylase
MMKDEPASVFLIPPTLTPPTRGGESSNIPSPSMGKGKGGADREIVRVIFDEPQWAPAPGQAAVFYDGDTVIGGGTIKIPA